MPVNMRYSLYPQPHSIPPDAYVDLPGYPLTVEHGSPLAGYRGISVAHCKTTSPIATTVGKSHLHQEVFAVPAADVIRGRKSLSLLVEQIKKGKHTTSAKSVSTTGTSKAVAVSDTSAAAKTAEPPLPPVSIHQKSESARVPASRNVNEAPKLESDMAPRRSTLAKATAKPLVLNATPALEPLPGRSPFDKSDPNGETPTRRAKSSTTIAFHVPTQSADLVAEGYSPTSFAPRSARQDLHGWPLPPTSIPSLSTSSSRHGSASSESSSSLYSTRPLPPLPTGAYLKRVAGDVAQRSSQRQMSPDSSSSSRPTASVQSLDHIPTPIKIPERPVTPTPTPYTPAAHSIKRSKSLGRRRHHLGLLTPSASTPSMAASDPIGNAPAPTYSSSIEDWSPVSPSSPTDFTLPPLLSPPPTFALPPLPDQLVKLDFCPTNNFDKRNLDWELASSIRTSVMSFGGRGSFDVFSTPRSSESTLITMQQPDRRQCRRSRSISTLRRPGQPATVLSTPDAPGAIMRPDLLHHPASTTVTRKPLPTLSPERTISVALSQQTQSPTEPSERQGSYWLPDEDDDELEHRHMLRRPRSLPIWRRVKAGLHLGRLLRPRSLGKLSKGASGGHECE